MTTTRKGGTDFQGDVAIGGQTVNDIKTSADTLDTGDTSLATTGYVAVHAGTSGFNDTFVDGDLTAGVLTVTHNLGQQLVHVTVADNNDNQIIPDDITFDTVNQCSVDLTSFGTLTGTWSISVGFGAGGVSSSPSLFSSTEEAIPGRYWETSTPGEYKQYYRKTVSIGALPNATSKDVAHGVTNFEIESIRLYGAAENNTAVLPLPFVTTVAANQIDVRWLDSTNLRIATGSNFSAYNGWIVVEYAKTTDVTTTNPNGILAGQLANYDTVEHLTGAKWIDGKDIYRKVIDMGSGPNATTKSVAHSITSQDRWLRVYLVFENGSSLGRETNSTVTSGTDESCHVTSTDVVWDAGAEDRTTYTGYIILEYTKV